MAKGIQPKTHRESLIDSVTNRLRDVTLWDYENDLLQKDRDGKAYPSAFVDSTVLFKILSEKLLDIDLNSLTEKMLEDLLQILKATAEALNQFSKEPKILNLMTPESQKVESFLSHFVSFQTIAVNCLSFISALGYKKESESEAILVKLREQAKEADEKIKSLDNLTQKAGIAGYSQLYKSISENEKNDASFWLKWVVATIVLTVAGGVALLFVQREGIVDDINLVQFTFTKIVIISCLFLSIGICIKNYRAHKHNEIINLHKSTALATFDALVKTQSNESVKDSILLAVTNTIFGNSSTGFNNVDNSSSDLSSKILDIVGKKNA